MLRIGWFALDKEKDLHEQSLNHFQGHTRRAKLLGPHGTLVFVLTSQQNKGLHRLGLQTSLLLYNICLITKKHKIQLTTIIEILVQRINPDRKSVV